MIKLDQLRKVFPSTAEKITHYIDPLNATFTKYGIVTKNRQAMFLAQVGHESANLTAVRENLNYSADGLRRVFPKYFDTSLATAYHRQPERIANRVYANRMGNGSESSGDGWKFRGRGAIQITGKENYTFLSKAMGHASLDVTIAWLETPLGAIMSAGWYWDSRKLNQWADTGDIITVTKKINGGTNGLDDRKLLYARALKVL
jgi:putative chitinase